MPFVSFDVPKPSGGFVDFDAPTPPKEDQGDFLRGGKEAFQQIPQMGYGLMAGAGAAAESAFGEGGIATGIKKAGVKGYQDASDAMAKNAKESDSWDYSYDQAKAGNFGALVDWLQHGLGYVGGQAIQTLAGGGIGTVGGKFVASTAAKQIADGMVAKEITNITASTVGKELSAEQIAKVATANVATKFAEVGQNTALGANAFGMEGGEIFGDLTKKSVDENRPLSGAELGKAFASSLAAGGLEFVGDKLGLDIMLGKSALLKPAESMTGIGGRLARGGIAAAGAAPIEGGTEYAQTMLEEYGKGNDPFSEETLRQAREAAALGVLGGVGVGGLGGAIHGAKQSEAAPAAAPKPLLLGNTPDPLLSFADGTVARRSEVDAYLASLPEDQQVAARARLYVSNRSTDPIAPIMNAGTTDEAIAAATESITRVGSQWQGIAPTAPLDDLAAQKQGVLDQRAAEEAGARASRETDARIADVGAQAQALNLRAPADDLNAQRSAALTTAPEPIDASNPLGTPAEPIGGVAAGNSELVGGERDRGLQPDATAQRNSDAAEAAAPGGGAFVVVGNGGLQSTPVAPVSTWSGRRGDGYLTRGDAEVALDARRQAKPELRWQIEPTPDGRFRLAGYATEVAQSTQNTPLRDQGTGSGETPAFGQREAPPKISNAQSSTTAEISRTTAPTAQTAAPVGQAKVAAASLTERERIEAQRKVPAAQVERAQIESKRKTVPAVATTQQTAAMYADLKANQTPEKIRARIVAEIADEKAKAQPNIEAIREAEDRLDSHDAVQELQRVSRHAANESDAAPVQDNTPKPTAREAAAAAERARIEQQRTDRSAAAKERNKPMEGLSVGTLPTNAEPVTVKDGVVHIGKYEAVNFDTGEPVTVTAGATNEQIRQALTDAGAIGRKQRFFTGEPKFDQSGRVMKTLASPAEQKAVSYQRVVNAIRAKWNNGPKNVVVVASINSLRVPKAIKDAAAELIARGGNPPSAVFYNGNIFLFADQLPNERAAAEALLHEAAHFGLHGNFGNRLDQILNMVAVQRKADIEAIITRNGFDRTDKASRRMAAEEYLAELAMKDPQELTEPERTLLRKVIDAIKAWLRENFPETFNFPLTDEYIANKILIPAKRWVEDGGPRAATNMEPAFSTKQDAFVSALGQQVAAVPAKQQPAAGWNTTLDGLIKAGKVKADEVEWSGVRDWLAMQDGKVSKDAISEYLAQNGVRVTEVEKGDTVEDKSRSDKLDELQGLSDDQLKNAADDADVDWDEFELQSGRIDRPALINAIMSRIADGAGETKEGTDTQYSDYQLPGGQNYRELLLTLPEQKPEMKTITDWQGTRSYPALDEVKSYRSNHWSEPNILAHIRFNERADADGKRVLFIEEIQSDWAQQGKRKGFAVKDVEAERARLYAEGRDREAATVSIDNASKVPGAPFVGKTDAWLALSIKRMVKYAADNGFDKVAFINGEQSADRYDLSKQVEIEYAKREGGKYWINVTEAGTHRDVTERTVPAAELENIVGKDVAQKILNGEGEGKPSDSLQSIKDRGKSTGVIEGKSGWLITFSSLGRMGVYPSEASARRQAAAIDVMVDQSHPKVLRGDDLKVGGEGMKTFYDKIVPGVAKDVLRKLGGGALHDVVVDTQGRPETGTGLMEKRSYTGPEYTSAELVHSTMRAKIDNARLEDQLRDVANAVRAGTPFAQAMAENGSIALAEKLGGKMEALPQVIAKQTGFDITPAMREHVAKGVPMFNQYIAGQTNRTHTLEQLRAMKAVGFAVEQPTMKERAAEIWKDAGKKLAQGLVDQFAPVKELGKEAYNLMRLSKGASGAFEAMLQGGQLKLTDGVYDFDETKRGGVVEKLLIPLQGEHQDFFRWIAANRAERLMNEWTVTFSDGTTQRAQGRQAAEALARVHAGAKAKPDSREHLFTPQNVADLKTLANGTTDFDYTIQTGAQAGTVTRDRTLIYADSLRKFNEFNKNVLDIAEQSGLIDKDARKVWESEFYIPFYRATDEDGSMRGATMKGGMVRQQAFKSLKGGKDKLNADLLDNTLMNWAHLLDAAAKNRAAKATIEAAEKMGVASPGNQSTLKQMGASIGNKNGVVWFMDGGEKRYSLVDDPYVMTAINALEYAGMRSPVMNAMSAMKYALTVGVTASPFFKVRNLIRDSVQVIGTSGISTNMASNVAKGWALTDPKSDAYFRLLAGGGTIHFGTMFEGSEAKRVQALVESGVDKATILNSDHKVKAFYRQYVEKYITAYNELGNRGEAINRASLYDQLVKQGMSHADASLQARDLMDFSMQGSFASIRFLTQVVPFFNARIQGLYKLGRAAKEDPARFSAVIGAAALASLALMATYHDDPDWKKREDWDRNNFWWFKVGGKAFRIPKPFEIGAIATLAERGFELAFEKEMTGKRFREQVLNLLSDNLSMNPIPQLVKPMLDVYANKDSFTGRPIETQGMENLKPEYRFTDRTSMAARAASTAMNAVTGVVGQNGLSPVQIDQMLRGYFSWLGTFIVSAGDVLARPATGQPQQAASDLWKVATGGMVSELRDAPSRYVSQMYAQAKEVEQAYGTYKMLVKDGKAGEAADFLQNNKKDIAQYRQIEAVKRTEAKVNERIRYVERSNLSPEVKRDLLRTLQNQKNDAASRLYAQ